MEGIWEGWRVERMRKWMMDGEGDEKMRDRERRVDGVDVVERQRLVRAYHVECGGVGGGKWRITMK